MTERNIINFSWDGESYETPTLRAPKINYKPYEPSH